MPSAVTEALNPAGGGSAGAAGTFTWFERPAPCRSSFKTSTAYVTPPVGSGGPADDKVSPKPAVTFVPTDFFFLRLFHPPFAAATGEIVRGGASPTGEL